MFFLSIHKKAHLDLLTHRTAMVTGQKPDIVINVISGDTDEKDIYLTWIWEEDLKISVSAFLLLSRLTTPTRYIC